MRFMMIVKANKDTEAGVMPEEKLIAEMTKYNEELVKAGVLLDLSGLQPSSKGARIKFSGGKRTVIDGPFIETKELIAGYWLIQVSAIYALLRMELVYQAAAHIRLFCENVITLRYILLDPDQRSKAFLDYAALDAYEIGKAYLQWESQTAKPQHVEAMSLQQAELEKRCAEVRGRYTYVDLKRKTREFKNWCNLTLKDQADECGVEMQKLYALGYRQLYEGDVALQVKYPTSLTSVRGMYVIRVFRIRAVVADPSSFGGVSASFR